MLIYKAWMESLWGVSSGGVVASRAGHWKVWVIFGHVARFTGGKVSAVNPNHSLCADIYIELKWNRSQCKLWAARDWNFVWTWHLGSTLDTLDLSSAEKNGTSQDTCTKLALHSTHFTPTTQPKNFSGAFFFQCFFHYPLTCLIKEPSALNIKRRGLPQCFLWLVADCTKLLKWAL